MTETTHPPQPLSTAEDHALLHNLRTKRRARRPRHAAAHPPANGAAAARSFGERLADAVAATVGSWGFIGTQSALIVLWIGLNLALGRAWDPYPFILLNLVLSFQAAYTAPAIMMSQNRQAAVDRQHAETDYEINVKAELEIELLHQKLDLMRETEILELTRLVRELSAQLERMAGSRQD
jgi:uncharacterized membrane protein